MDNNVYSVTAKRNSDGKFMIEKGVFGDNEITFDPQVDLNEPDEVIKAIKGKGNETSFTANPAELATKAATNYTKLSELLGATTPDAEATKAALAEALDAAKAALDAAKAAIKAADADVKEKLSKKSVTASDVETAVKAAEEAVKTVETTEAAKKAADAFTALATDLDKIKGGKSNKKKYLTKQRRQKQSKKSKQSMKKQKK